MSGLCVKNTSPTVRSGHGHGAFVSIAFVRPTNQNLVRRNRRVALAWKSITLRFISTKIRQQPSSSNSIETNSSAPNVPNSELTTLTSSISNKIVLLATTVIEVKDMHGNFHRVRVILDNYCSQGSFITQKCLRRLGLRFTPSTMHVKGINPGAGSISPGFSECLIRPRNSSIEQQKNHCTCVAQHYRRSAVQSRGH
jgi:hypothetical protein